MLSDVLCKFFFRFALFIFVIVLLVVAGKMVKRLLFDEEYRKKHFKHIRKKWVVVIVLYSAGLIAGAYAIYELCVGNPNEFLSVKIIFYIVCWGIVGITVADDPSSHSYLPYILKSETVKSIYDVLDVIRGCLAVFGIPLLIVFFIYGAAVAPYFLPHTEVERELVDSTELVAANDGQETNGNLFSISEDGVYRYYYQTGDGGKKQDCVEAGETTIYDTREGEVPHLDELTSYTIITHMRNNRPWEEKKDGKTWYELYVPEGSVVESYVFDLQ